MSKMSEVPPEDLLSFQDQEFYVVDVHTPTSEQISQPKVDSSLEKTPGFRSFEDDDSAIGTSETETTNSAKYFWTIEYYQQFFDVDTKEVVDRMIASMIPKSNQLERTFKHKPDLYGPFWISITLIFTIAISGNIVSYIQHADSKTDFNWQYDFHLVSCAATIIFLYVLGVPLLIWGLLKWSTDTNNADEYAESIPSMLQLVCLYGYSLFIYIPVSVLWSIQVSMLQWILVFVSAVLSTSVLLFTLLPALRMSKHRILLIIGIIVFHFTMTAGFMLYFFHVKTP